MLALSSSMRGHINLVSSGVGDIRYTWLNCRNVFASLVGRLDFESAFLAALHPTKARKKRE